MMSEILKKISLIKIFCIVMLAVHNIAFAETNDVLESGWINSITTDAIIINDTQYKLNGETRFPDGKSKLKEGEFVQFNVKADYVVSHIFITEPREEDMYMKPIDRSKKTESESVESRSIQADVESGSTEMRFENGKWVN